MTLLSDLIDTASHDTTPVSTLLRKVKVIAARLRTSDLAAWVEHELVGYPEAAGLPAYRGPFRTEVVGHFTGLFGHEIRNAPIPPMGFPNHLRDGSLFHIEFRQPIVEIEQVASSSESVRAYWAADAIAYTNQLIESGAAQLYPDMSLVQAWRALTVSQMAAVVDAVRTRIVDLALELEEIEPEAGQPGASVSEAQVKSIVTNVYGGAPNIAVASTNVEQAVNVPATGSKDELYSCLANLGVGDDALEEFQSALQEDEGEGHAPDTHAGPGPRVKAWLGELAVQGASTTEKVAAGAAGGLVARAVASYFGLS